MAHQSQNAALTSRLTFLLDQVRQKLRVRPVFACRLLGRRQVGLAERRQTQLLQLIRQFGRVDRRRQVRRRLRRPAFAS